MWKLILFVGLAVHCALSMRIKCTNTPAAALADSATYDKARNSVYYIDFKDSREPCLFRYDITKKRTYSAYIKGPSLGSPGFIVPNKDAKTFTVGFSQFVGIVRWDGKSDCATLVRELYRGGPGITPDLGPNERIYDGERDPSGRWLYVGTMDLALCGVPANQSVHVKRRGSPQVRVLRGLSMPVGIASTKDCVYVVDACQLKIWAIPDQHSKHKSHKSDEPYVVIDFTKHGKSTEDFAPTALEVDSKGILYTVNYYSGCIYSINPRTRKFRKVAKLPVKGPTSLSFGDDNGKGQNLYVSVASDIYNLETAQLISTEDPGCALFEIECLGEGIDYKRYKP